MGNSTDGAPLKDPIPDFFGPPPPRRPISSNSFSALVKIFCLFPHQNPFSESAQLLDDSHNELVAPADEKEASNGLIGSSTEANKLSVCEEPNKEGTAGDLSSKTVRLSGSKLIIDELGRTNKNNMIDKIPSDEEGTTTGMAEVDKVHKDLSGIERILMDESDDFGMLILQDKDVSSDFLNDFSFILDTDLCGNICTTIESRKLTVDGYTKGDVVCEKKQKDVEVNRSTSGGDEAKSHVHLSVVREISECQEVANPYNGTCPGEPRRKERKLSKEKIPQDSAQKSNNGGTVSNSIRTGNKSGIATKGKTKKAKDKSVKDVNSGKSRILLMDDETSNRMKSGGTDPVVHGKTVKQNVYGTTGKFSAKKVENNQSVGLGRLQYTQEELLNLQKMTSVPEEFFKSVRELGAELLGKDPNSPAGKMIDASSGKKLGACTEDKVAEEKGNKKQGTSSETRKEKKKRQKRKKRAEMNKKLGVKRLKLKPVVKPKVTQPCRHYLKGRCQEGEKCKFSHDVIPLTKSKPCCHFARQACMKGDDCPYDHQLSNYSCNSYVATGVCSRGDSCLFSHKISAKEGSGTAAGISKSEITALDQLNKSNYNQQFNANTSFSSGIATPKSLKEDIPMQTSLRAKAPKGLYFLSSGTSSPKDSHKHKEADSSQKSGSTAGTGGQPTIATSPVKLVKTLMDTPASVAAKGKGFISFVRDSFGSSGDKKQANPSFHRDSSSYDSFWKSSLEESAKHETLDSCNRSDTAATGTQLNKGISSRVLNASAISEGNPAPMIPKQVSVPASGAPPYDICGKSQATLPTNGHLDSQNKVSRSVKGSDKAIQQKLWGSPTSSGQCSKKVGVTPSTAQRAFQSTLAFAAKFESGIKLTSAPRKEVTKNEGTSSRQNDPSKASAILEFLYSGDYEEK